MPTELSGAEQARPLAVRVPSRSGAMTTSQVALTKTDSAVAVLTSQEANRPGRDSVARG